MDGMTERKRPRKLTRREKIIASRAGFAPREWMLAGIGERYLLLENKRTGARAYAEINPRPVEIAISVVDTAAK